MTPNQFDREEQFLEDQLMNGEITQEEFNREIKELYREYREAAEDSASSAYDRELESW